MSGASIHLATRAKVSALKGDEASALLEIAKANAPDPTVFDRHPPFFWSVLGSSNRLDYYFTRMNPETTLPNFVRALKEGVSYQDSHQIDRNGMGQSLDGRLVESNEVDPETGQKIVNVYGDFFTLPDLRVNGQDLSDVVTAIGAGMWRDVSVGFSATDITCSICGKQSFEWWKEDGCQHIPGVGYDIPDGNGGTVRRVAFAWINDGNLNEISSVYKGATPGASVVKAQTMSEAGILPDHERSVIERTYNVRLADPVRRYTLGELPGTGGSNVGTKVQKISTKTASRKVDDDQVEDEKIDPTDEAVVEDQREEVPDDEDETVIEPDEDDEADDESGDDEDETTDERVIDDLSAVRERFAPHGLRIGKNLARAVEVLGDEVIRLRKVNAETRKLADVGRAYRSELIEDALSAGTRALGKGFRMDQYRAMLDRLDVDDIRTMRDDWLARGDQMFGKGRITRDDAEDEAPTDITEARRKADPDRYRA